MREAKGFVVGVVFAAVVAGFSVAMPHAIVTVAHDTERELVADRSPSRRVDERRERRGARKDARRHGDASHVPTKGGSKEKAEHDNHGAAVSEAAKCPLKGRAHGELVRSVAHDKTATPESAREACAHALAGGAASVRGDGSGHARAPKVPKPPKP